jgi:hypothetical protein
MSDARFLLLGRLILAVAFVGFYGFIVLKVLTLTQSLPDGTKEILLFLLGALTTSVVTVVGFFFTSSQSSVAKDELVLRATYSEQGKQQ